MHVLKSIEIHGFRRQKKPIFIELDRHANFVIGRNGTGKTTLINLISAALTRDLSVLRFQYFDEITLKFDADGSRKTPAIQVVRKDDELPYDVEYRIRNNSKENWKAFDLSRRRLTKQRYRGEPEDFFLTESMSEDYIPLGEVLSKIYRLTWLSLQRRRDDSSEIEDYEDYEERKSDVDKKLDQVFNETVRYFSRLDKKVSEDTEAFQKQWFLSFLMSDLDVNRPSLRKIDIYSEKKALSSIFSRFQMTSGECESRLEKHFSSFEEIRDRENNKITSNDMFVLTNTLRLHYLVDQWQKLQETQRNTYEPKIKFIKICSDMLYRKDLFIDRSNLTQIVSVQKNAIPINSLSSGEKQLLIFLSETLLQEGESHIFLADEPELSLHVEWQEELVPNLLRINPNAQVLFATHSPDIVGRFQGNVIRMEELTE